MLELRSKPECQRLPEDWDLSQSRYAVQDFLSTLTRLILTARTCLLPCAASCMSQLSSQEMPRLVCLELLRPCKVSQCQRELSTLHNKGRTTGAVLPHSLQVYPEWWTWHKTVRTILCLASSCPSGSLSAISTALSKVTY